MLWSAGNTQWELNAAAVAWSMVWSDQSANPHLSTSSDFYNDYKVGGLDTDTQTISY
jgi:hypothetical protein